MLVIDVTSKSENAFFSLILTRIKSEHKLVKENDICTYSIKIISGNKIIDLNKTIEFKYGDSLKLSIYAITTLLNSEIDLDIFIDTSFRYKKHDPINIDISINRNKYLQCFNILRTKDKFKFISNISSPLKTIKDKEKTIILSKDSRSLLFDLILKVFETYETYEFDKNYELERFVSIMKIMDKK